MNNAHDTWPVHGQYMVNIQSSQQTHYLSDIQLARSRLVNQWLRFTYDAFSSVLEGSEALLGGAAVVRITQPRGKDAGAGAVEDELLDSRRELLGDGTRAGLPEQHTKSVAASR